MKNKIHSSVAAILATALAACSPKPEAAPTPTDTAGRVTVTPAQRQRLHLQVIHASTFRQSIETTGTVGFDNDRSTTVLAPISGPVSRLLVSLGAKVQAGEALAQVDSPDYAAAIGSYRKAVITARNLRRIAVLDQQLFDADALARRDLEQAQTDAVNGEADRDAARQQLRSIGVTDEAIQDIDENRPAATVAGVIRAPLSGTVVEKLITPGQLLQAGTTPCFTVADLSKVWVSADLFESQLSAVAVGNAAEVVTSAGSEHFPGKVDNISAILDPNSRSIGVRVTVQNPGELLKKQMYVRVLIHSSKESSGLLVPVAAILRDDENLPFVYLVEADGSFSRRHVTVGSRVGEQYEVTSGLKDGEQLVVDGGLFVQFQQNQ